MSASVKEPLLPAASPALSTTQQEATRSFEVEMEESAALPSASSAVAPPPHTPLLDRRVHPSGNGAAASLPKFASNSAVSSLASPGPSTTERQARPTSAATTAGTGNGATTTTTAAAGAASGSLSYHAAGSVSSTRLLTCAADTSAEQRAEEYEASRDPAFNPMVVCPLQNLGNTCYFNSGVQMLANCPALIYGLRNSPFFQLTRTTSPLQSRTATLDSSTPTIKLCLRGGESTHALFQEFAALLSRMENNNLANGECLSPVRALDALAHVYTQFEGRSQQDAAEMMIALLSSLEEEGGQYVEVEPLLSSFAEDALAAAATAANEASPRVTSADTAATSNHNSTSCNTNNSTNNNNNNTHRTMTSTTNASCGGGRRNVEPYMADEYSQASPLTSVKTTTAAAAAAAAMPGARSAHEIAMLRFMKEVNSENEQLERRVKQRQGKPYLGTFRAPRLHLNPVMDGFRGYSVSQVECHHCHSVSRVVSDYNALLLDIPTSRQRSQFAAKHPTLRRLAPNGQPLQNKKHSGFTWWNPLSYFSSAWGHIARLFTSSVPFPLTLQECLDIHFEPVKLQGSNKYRCDSCGTTSEATKSETLLGLPEYLVLHMKRFEAGRCFNGKKTDPVIFPASWTPLSSEDAARKKLPGSLPEILDLRRYLHAVAAPYAEPIPECLQASLGAALEEREAPSRQAANAFVTARSPTSPPPPPALTANADGATPWAIPTTYTLDGIVNHHGGYDGGHYTVYLYKATTEQSTWVYISDDEIAKASAGDAADSEEYVLLYRRQPIVQPAVEVNEGEQLRQKACYYLSRETSKRTSPVTSAAAATAAKSTTEGSADGSTPATAPPYVYISRMWLQRVAFLHEPGPIVNRLCYCTPADQAKVTTHRTLFPSTVRVPEEVPHVHGPPVEWFYVPITQTDYDIFYDAFGGNTAVTAAEVERIREMQATFVEAIVAAERAKSRSGGPMNRGAGPR